MPIRSANIPDPDAFHEELIAAQRDLNNAQADLLMSEPVVTLSSHMGDPHVLSEALALARPDTLKH